MLAPLVGHGSAIATGTPPEVFAYLAQPRHAASWFTTVPLEDLPAGAPSLGQRWMFRQQGRPIPVEVTEYVPPNRFTWRTTRGRLRDNLAWSVHVHAVDTTSSAGTPAGTPADPEPEATRNGTSESGAEASPPQCAIAVSISLTPSPLARIVLLFGRSGYRQTLAERAQRAAERAAAAIPTRSSRASRSSQQARYDRPDMHERKRPRRGKRPRR